MGTRVSECERPLPDLGRNGMGEARTVGSAGHSDATTRATRRTQKLPSLLSASMAAVERRNTAAGLDHGGELAGKKNQIGFFDRPDFLARAAGDSFLLQRQNHQAAAHQTSDGIVFVQGVLDAGDDAAGGVSSLVGKGDHCYNFYTE